MIGVQDLPQGWAYIWWENPGEESLRFGLEFRNLQQSLKERGYRGWCTASNPEHTNMHRHIVNNGGIEYARNEKFVYFKKEFN